MLLITCELSIKPPKLEFNNRYVDELLSTGSPDSGVPVFIARETDGHSAGW